MESREWKTIYRLRFVLDGMRSIFSLVVFEEYFHVQIKCSCKSKTLTRYCVLVVWTGPEGDGGSEIYIYIYRFNGLEK